MVGRAVAVVLQERKKKQQQKASLEPQNQTCIENTFHVARDRLWMALWGVHLHKLHDAHSSQSPEKKKTTEAVQVTSNEKLASHKVTWQPLLNRFS